jgi:DNA-binding transcriptional regulator GbsR (MarR family)
MNKDTINSEDIKNQYHLYSEKLRKYEDKLVDFFIDIGTRKRVNSKMIQISSYLLIHKSLTQKELRELTGLSMGTISTFLTVMIGMGRFQKERIPKTHTFTYSYSGNIDEMTIRGIEVMINSLTSMGVYLKSKKNELKELEKQNKKGASHLSQRIDELLDIFDFYKEVFPEVYKSNLPKKD